MAFVDDYTAWVTGPSEDSNRAGIQDIVDNALSWAARSGATFESEKTKVIHFTRNRRHLASAPITVENQAIGPQDSVKILGVIMDTGLRYRQHMARVATRGLNAAMALARLSMLSPRTARQLFTSTVAPVMDYASNVWAHRCQAGPTKEMRRVQKTGACAITGAWKTVAVAEAEADIAPVTLRLQNRATYLWTNLCTLPKTHPLARMGTRHTRRFTSPLQKIRLAQGIEMDRMECIEPFPAAPWTARVPTLAEDAEARTVNEEGIVIVTSASSRNGNVGIGGAFKGNDERTKTFSATLGPRTELSPYYAELEAVARALRVIPDSTALHTITVWTRNRTTLSAVTRPRQQSGQQVIRRIYEEVRRLKVMYNEVQMGWLQAQVYSDLLKQAKSKARAATTRDAGPEAPCVQARESVRCSIVMETRQAKREIPKEVGAYSKKIDTALPGRHTRTLYDELKREEARMLAQLRTGMARINGYLCQIGITDSEKCRCGKDRETVEHFLFECPQWEEQRKDLLRSRETKKGNLSFFVGGKTTTDDNDWTPNMAAVRATVKFAIATKRLSYVPE